MTTDYIELKPNDVIRDGDEYQKPGFQRTWNKVNCRLGHGDRVGDWPDFVFRRPRSTLIKDAAIRVLKSAIRDDEFSCLAHVDAYALEALRVALNVSVEQLRKGGEA